MDAVRPRDAADGYLQAKSGSPGTAVHLPGDLGGVCTCGVAGVPHADDRFSLESDYGLRRVGHVAGGWIVARLSNCESAYVRRFFDRGRGRDEQGFLAVANGADPRVDGRNCVDVRVDDRAVCV